MKSVNNYYMKEKEVNIANSKKIAGLIGPTLIVLSITEAMNLHIWATNIASVIYLNGTLLFVAGLSIVRVHNIWRGWPMIITITGWVILFGGLFRMFAPEAKQAGENTYTYVMFIFLFLIGFFLTYKSYYEKEGNANS